MSKTGEPVIHLAQLNGNTVSARLSAFLAEREADPATAGIAIAVVGAGAELVAFGAHTACTWLSRLVAHRKAITAATFRRSSESVAREVKEGTLNLVQFHDDRLLAMAGGVPLSCEGRVIGGVGVSGLTAAADAAVAEAFAKVLLG